MMVRWLTLVAVVAAMACACVRSESDAVGFTLTNRTERVLLIAYIGADGVERQPIIHALNPGGSYPSTDRFLVNGCMDGILVARDSAGAEVARRPGPICTPGEWIIEEGS